MPIVTWLWGGFGYRYTPTLGRFYALHYLMAIVLFVVGGVYAR